MGAQLQLLHLLFIQVGAYGQQETDFGTGMMGMPFLRFQILYIVAEQLSALHNYCAGNFAVIICAVYKAVKISDNVDTCRTSLCDPARYLQTLTVNSLKVFFFACGRLRLFFK